MASSGVVAVWAVVNSKRKKEHPMERVEEVTMELVAMEAIHNRAEDVAWARCKIEWLWEASEATGPMLRM